ALAVARSAGTIIREAFYANSRNAYDSTNIDTKQENHADLVTITDKKVQEHIHETLVRNYPSHKFLGEESIGVTKEALTDDWTWCVDPIDGTTNFVHGLPLVCTCIALILNKEVMVGVVYNPILNDCFYAVKGKGAFYNNTSLPDHPSTIDASYQRLPLQQPPRPLGSNLSTLLGATEYGSDLSDPTLESKLTTIRRTLSGSEGLRGIRSLGTAGLNMCMVARGSVDVYWETGFYIWDIAAASLIVREAGGSVVNWTIPDSSRHESSDGHVRGEWLDLMARNAIAIRPASKDSDVDKVVAQLRSMLEPVRLR
ncbi:hypothetical protein BJ742DRAFT_685032, partial [Cladochytrium replicatum]